MFEAEIGNPKLFYSCFDAISAIVDEVKIMVDSEGLRLNALDRSKSNFVHLNLKAEFFDKFVCDDYETININSFSLTEVLKLIKSDTTVKLSLNEYNLVVVGEGETKSSFKLGLLEDSYESPNPPKFDFPATINIESKVFKSIMKKIEKFNKVGVNLKITPDNLVASGENHINNTIVEYLHIDKVIGEHKSRIKIDKILQGLKASDFSDVLKISIGNDLPFLMKFELDSEDGELSFLIAPLEDKSE